MVNNSIAAGALLLAASGAAHSADFPVKPARIVVPIGAGSSMDIVGRVLAQKFTEIWGQTVIVDNRAGAGGQTRAVNRDPLAGCERP